MKKPHKPKSKLLKSCIVLASGAVLVTGALAQEPPAPPPPGNPPAEEEGPRGPGKKPKGPRPDPGQATQISGVVSQYLLNGNGEADGLLLQDGTQVKFPPHMSADLVKAVRPNDKVNIEGSRESSRRVRAFTISDEATHQTVTESRPSEFRRPLPPELRGLNLKPMEASGQIKAVLTAPRGEVEGAVLNDGTILRVKPDVGQQFANLFVVGQTISAKGYGTQNALGRAFQVTDLGASAQKLTALYGPEATSASLTPPSVKP